MPHRLRTLLVLALAVTSGIAVMAARQAPAVPPQLRTSVIFGRVLDDATGRPVRDAVVTLGGLPVSPPPPGVFGVGTPPPIALTDASGQFMFRDLPAGRFTLSVTAAGYLGGGYGQRRPDGSTRQLVVRDNEAVNDADIRLWKSAAVSGMVFDESGPAVQITVVALRRVMVRGRMQLTPVSAGRSDDRGMYRIYGLLPGSYLVSMPTTITSIPASVAEQGFGMDPNDPNLRRFGMEVSMAGTSGAVGGVNVGDQQVYTYYERPLAPSVGDTDRFLVYPTTFAPAAASPSAAGLITVASGDERTGVDLHITMTSTHRIAGTLSGPDGPAANVAVRLSPAFADDLASDEQFVTSMTSTDARGHFTLVGVPTGDYTLRAIRAPIPNASGPMALLQQNGSVLMVNQGTSAGPVPGGSDVTLSVEAAVTVAADRDPAPLALTLQPGVRVSGRVAFTGTAAPPTPDQMTRMFLALSRADGKAAGATQSQADRTGMFKTPQVPPGGYLISMGSSIAPWTLRSFVVDGHDALEGAVELTHDLTDAVATFTDRLPELNGTVRRTGANEADVKATVAIFPANVDAWIASGMIARRARLVDAAPNGSFDARGLLPGDYLVAAFDLATSVDLQDPKDIAALARIGTRVTIGEVDQKTVSLTVGRVR